jgi:peptidoglycan hydrolase-like protein with peptidoglycan-binding domain
MRPRLLAASVAALVTTLLAGAPAPATTSTAAVMPVMPRAFTGYAFDACQTPSQADMDVWRTSSPFWGVGVYVAGANRLCDVQPNLNATWVSTQASRGWRILPITVGRQASCNAGAGVTRINPDPTNEYAAARAQGRAEASSTITASHPLGFAKGTTHWLDIEDFDLLNTDCRRSVLGFVSGWTSRLHALGYKSGLYSNVAAGIKAVEGARTLSPGSYTLPDQLWFAHYNGQATTSTSALAPEAWRHQRIHQYFGDSTRTYGGITLDIDLNWMDVGGGTKAPAPAPHCGVRIDFASYTALRRGDSGLKVKALQCLLRQKGVYGGSLNGRYDLATARAVLRFQKRHTSLTDTGVTTRSTWMVLLSAGSPTFSKVGSGSNTVRRLQRALNAAAAEELTISGVFDRRTESAVKRYQMSRDLPPTGVMTSTTWAPLQQGLR